MATRVEQNPSMEEIIIATKFLIGVIYFTGQGVPQSSSEAVKWFNAAAEQGYAMAQRGLAVINEYSSPMSKTENLNRLATEQSEAYAQYYLGYVFSTGLGLPQNDAEAVKWYRLAAERGYVDAQCALGRAYDAGQGVPQSDAEAVKWYRLAAEQGNATAQYFLGMKYDIGQGIPQSDTEALKWYRLAAERGYAPAQNNLGNMYHDGRGGPKSETEAVKW